MKKSTLRMAVLSACVGAGLALTGCGSGSAEGAGAGEDTAAADEAGTEDTVADEGGADAAADAAYTAEDLTAAVEAGGFEAQEMDPADAESATTALGDMTIEPAECEVFMNASLAAADSGDMTLIVGMPGADAATTTGGAMGYASADEAASMLDSSISALGACGEMTITMQGMEMSSKTTEVDAEVEGADKVVATEVEMDVAGQPMTTTSVQVQKGSAILTASSASGAGMEGEDLDALTAIAADMIAALP